jgi:hypothetical protein
MLPASDSVVRSAVLGRLDMLDRMAGSADPGTLLPFARTELNRLADGWRLLLAVHKQAEDGRCGACPSGIRGRRWPCQVWRMAHEHLIGEGVSHRQRTRPLRSPFGAFSRAIKGRHPVAPPESPAEITVEMFRLSG